MTSLQSENERYQGMHIFFKLKSEFDEFSSILSRQVTLLFYIMWCNSLPTAIIHLNSTGFPWSTHVMMTSWFPWWRHVFHAYLWFFSRHFHLLVCCTRAAQYITFVMCAMRVDRKPRNFLYKISIAQNIRSSSLGRCWLTSEGDQHLVLVVL